MSVILSQPLKNGNNSFMKSIVEQIFIFASSHPEKIALIEGKKAISYRELVQKIISSKRILKEKFHLKCGERILLSASKQPEFVYVYFAAHLSGIIVVPVDSETNPGRLALILQKTAPSLIVGFNSLENDQYHTDFSSFESESVPDDSVISFPNSEGVADIIFTTGTTGDPKGVILTHKNISASAFNINTFIQNTEEDIELLALPVSHSFGLGRMRCVLLKGATLVLLGSFVNVKRFYRFIEDYNISGLALVPASWAFLKKMSGERLGKYTQLRYIEIGSAPMPVEDKYLLMRLLPSTRICMHYGLTEASRSAFIEFHSEASKLNTVGKATPNVTIKIKDEKGTDVSVGNEGEICVKGDSVTLGYWQDSESDQQAFWQDYFKTGDWGMIDAEGYLSLKSRKKELINIGGKKVSPIEVETLLLQQKGIAECACIGIADPNHVLGEVVKAFLVRADGANILTIDEIKKGLEGKLEAYKFPVEYEWIDAIPKTASGKIQRMLLNNINNVGTSGVI